MEVLNRLRFYKRKTDGQLMAVKYIKRKIFFVLVGLILTLVIGSIGSYLFIYHVVSPYGATLVISQIMICWLIAAFLFMTMLVGEFYLNKYVVMTEDDFKDYIERDR